MVLPSGDHRGEPVVPRFINVTGAAFEPSASHAQIS
jgi:hypothetical protein